LIAAALENLYAAVQHKLLDLAVSWYYYSSCAVHHFLGGNKRQGWKP
jgi:hypothetical protein